MSLTAQDRHDEDDDVGSARRTVDETDRHDKNSKQNNAKQKNTKYKVSVFTGDKPDAGTDANVFINLIGEHGESGKRPLDNKLKDDFQPGKKDEFTVESSPLGKLNRINIGHDNSSRSPEWFLDKVTVEDLNEKRVYEFPCNRWFAKNQDDGHISRDIVCSHVTGDTLTEKVGRPQPKETDKNGDKKDKDNHKPSEASQRNKSPSTARKDHSAPSTARKDHNAPETPRNDKHDANTTHRDKERDRSTPPPSHKQDVPRNNKERDRSTSPPRNKQGTNTPRKDKERDRSTSPPRHKQDKPRTNKERDRSTSPPRNKQGTNTPRKDKESDRSTSPPRHKQDKPRTNRSASPRNKLHDTATPSTKHDRKSSASTPRHKPDTHTPKTNPERNRSTSPANRNHHPEPSGRTPRDAHKMPPTKNEEKKKDGSKHDDDYKTTYDKAERVVVGDRPHHDKGAGKGSSKSPQEHKNEHKNEQKNEAGGKNKKTATKYKVSVFTGDKPDAGTDANVFINLIGEHGESGKRALDNKLKDDFRRGKKDEFTVESSSLGKLQRINIGHDNSSRSPEWFLDKVTVEDLNEKRVYEFPCNRWFATKQDDGKTSRDLVCGPESGGPHSKTQPAKNEEKKKNSPKHDDDRNTAKKVVFGDHVDKNTGRGRSSSPQQHKTEQKKEANKKADGGRDSSADDRSRSPSRRARSMSPRGRALSGRRHKIDDMLQRVNKLNAEMEALKRENRELRWKQKLAERKLENYEVKSSELPTLVERQAVEMHVLGEKLQKHKDKYDHKEKQIKETEEELDKTRRLVNQLKGIVEDKQLEERHDLHRKLSKAEVALQEKEKAVKSLESYIDNLNKNYKHEVKAERNKYATSRQQLDELEDKLDRMKQQIQERNKEMELRNMHADQLTPRHPHRLNDSLTPNSNHRKTTSSDENEYESDDNARPKRKETLKRLRHQKNDVRRGRSVSNERDHRSGPRSSSSRSPSARRSPSRSRSRSPPQTVTFYDGPSYGGYKPTYTGPPKQRSPRTARRVQWPSHPVTVRHSRQY